jgi:hypothetical protein
MFENIDRLSPYRQTAITKESVAVTGNDVVATHEGLRYRPSGIASNERDGREQLIYMNYPFSRSLNKRVTIGPAVAITESIEAGRPVFQDEIGLDDGRVSFWRAEING